MQKNARTEAWAVGLLQQRGWKKACEILNQTSGLRSDNTETFQRRKGWILVTNVKKKKWERGMSQKDTMISS